jgi:hypothetical protein
MTLVPRLHQFTVRQPQRRRPPIPFTSLSGNALDSEAELVDNRL